MILEGFIEHIKQLGKIKFLILRGLRQGFSDSFKVQLVCDTNINIPRESYLKALVQKEQHNSNLPSYKLVQILYLEKSIEIKGDSLRHEARFRDSKFELLSNRRKENQNKLILRSLANQCIRQNFSKKGSIELQTPKLMPSFSEGGSELFKVPFNDDFFYLSQSPQLYKQAAICMGLSSVYQIGPIFRAEKFKTTRHLNEAICLDYEAVTTNLNHLIDVLKKTLIEAYNGSKAILSGVLSQNDFHVVSYRQAIDKLGLNYGDDLTIEFERKIPSLFNKTYVFVTHYPWFQKPFYIKGQESFDLLGPQGELCSGGLRQTSYNVLKDQMIKHNINPDSLKDYLDMFKLGCPPMGGFGLGLDRLYSFWLNLKNIKEVKVF